MATASNRREKPRHLTCTPAGVESPEKNRLALIRDASSTGALLFSKSQFPVDTPLKITIRVDNAGTTDVKLDARVVRVERLNDAFWTFGIGVLFVPPREDLAELFVRMAERQATLFGTGSR